ncbi:alpha/beta hydrolase [Paenibacillus sp. CAU 1782]
MNDNHKRPFSIAGTKEWSMYCEAQSEYRIYLYIPNAPAPEEGYSVLYLLDANAIFGSAVEGVRMEQYTYDNYEAAVVVGIGYPTAEPFDFKRRFWDYTIHATNDESPEGMELPEVGGASQFLRFIEERLKPEIARTVPVNPAKQAIFGHSLGGFFVLHTLFNHPKCFQTYMAGSPSIWWKNRCLMQNVEDFCNGQIQLGGQKALYLAVGSEEIPYMVEDAAAMFKRLATRNSPLLKVDFKLFEGEGHLSILQPMIGKALDFFLRKRDGSDSD